VTINSKENTYRGARAELDLQNDISRLLPAPGQRVTTTIRPKDKKDDSSTGAQPAPVN
jgi:lipopolysaccharide export system protein LptA